MRQASRLCSFTLALHHGKQGHRIWLTEQPLLCKVASKNTSTVYDSPSWRTTTVVVALHGRLDSPTFVSLQGHVAKALRHKNAFVTQHCDTFVERVLKTIHSVARAWSYIRAPCPVRSIRAFCQISDTKETQWPRRQASRRGARGRSNKPASVLREFPPYPCGCRTTVELYQIHGRCRWHRRTRIGCCTLLC